MGRKEGQRTKGNTKVRHFNLYYFSNSIIIYVIFSRQAVPDRLFCCHQLHYLTQMLTFLRKSLD